MPSQVLWVDDDGPRRYLFEEYALKEKGWAVTWALNARDAANLLRDCRFDVAFIDQTLPFTERIDAEIDIWGGCRLLYWLRRRETSPPNVPGNAEYDALGDLEPQAGNVEIPVRVITAFYDEDVEKATRGASERDRVHQFIRKPIDVKVLLHFLERLQPARE